MFYKTCNNTTHQSTILLVDTLNWEVLYKDLVIKVVCDPSNCDCMMNRCTNCAGKNTCKFLEEELSDIYPDFQFHYSPWQTADRASQANFLRAKKESQKENEVIVLGDFAENHHFHVQDEIQSYCWIKEYCTLYPLVVYFIGSDGNI